MSPRDDSWRHLEPVDPPPDPYGDDGPQRPLHHNIEAEQELLGALLRAPELAPHLADTLDPEDFYQPRHEILWRTVHHLAADGGALTPALVLQQLQLTGDLHAGQLDGPYLHTLMGAAPGTPTRSGAAALADAVLDASRLRRVGEVATRLAQIVHTGRADQIDDKLSDALDTLDRAVAHTGASRTTTRTGLRDLTWLFNGHAPTVEPPAWGRRTNGHALFYAGRVNGIYGDPEAAKSWLAQVAIVEALHAGKMTAFVDVDHNGMDHTAARLLLLGARIEHLADPHLFRYYEPDDGAELRAAVHEITGLAPAIVVLDSVGEMLPMLGVKSVDNDEITAAMRVLASPPAQVGSCVITIDHLPKSAEARATGFAIGGTAKKRAIDGSYLHAEARVQPAPGAIGRITLRIEKDRPGELRKTSTGKYVGTFTLDSTADHCITTTIGADDSPITHSGQFRPTHLMEQVSRFVEDSDLCTGRNITDHIRGKTTHVRAAIDRLIEEGYISPIAGPNRSTLHHSVAVYRESEDEQS